MSTIALFEEDVINPMNPLTLAKPTFKLIYAYRPLLTHLKRGLGRIDAYYVPERFELLLKELETNVAVNPDKLDGEALLVNARLRPSRPALEAVKALKVGQYLSSEGDVAAARVSAVPSGLAALADGGLRHALKGGGAEELEKDGALLRGPWELVASLQEGLSGTGVVYGSHVDVEEPVYFDTSKGPVLIADEARIEAFSRIAGPALIGKKAIIHSARIYGRCFIGDECRVGGEMEASIVQGFTNKAHFGYLGHSYVGEWVNIGAGAVTSNLKNTYGTIRVETPRGRVDTGLTKLGSFFADQCKVSINASIYAGKGLGMASHVHGLVSEDVKPFVIHGASLGWGEKELLLESALESLKRMKARRNRVVSNGEEQLLKLAFEAARRRISDRK